MSQIMFPFGLEKDDSSVYEPSEPLTLPLLDLGHIYAEADADIKVPIPPIFPSIQPLEVRGAIFSILIIPQIDRKVVTRISTSKFNATGQGDTEEEALNDIKSAIELLLEEEVNPSGDVQWPENYR